MRGIQGALILSSFFQMTIGFLGIWRNIVRFLSPLSMVPLITFTGLGLYYLGFPLVSYLTQWTLQECLIYVWISHTYIYIYLYVCMYVCMFCFSMKVSHSKYLLNFFPFVASEVCWNWDSATVFHAYYLTGKQLLLTLHFYLFFIVFTHLISFFFSVLSDDSICCFPFHLKWLSA